MGCSACSTVVNGKPAGCKSNGGCASGGCNKLNVFNWLSHMEEDINSFSVVEVRFKNGRKDFFRNKNGLELTTGDAIIVDVPGGHDLGHVSLQGELVRLQMKKKKVRDDENIRGIYRLASARDIEKYRETGDKEETALMKTREMIADLDLEMKLTDVEFQADGHRAVFYYSADNRVDFRELIRLMAAEFSIRVEMRQISLRKEAGRLGGIGACGRELCCSTWLAEPVSVSIQTARYQNLSLNPGKLAGQCGRLKCCLNYELDLYMDALQDIPRVNAPLMVGSRKAVLQKTDIFRKIMWFSFDAEDNWYPVSTERVADILKMNKAGIKPATLLLDDEEEEAPPTTLNKDLVEMDRKFRKKFRPNRKPYKKRR